MSFPKTFYTKSSHERRGNLDALRISRYDTSVARSMCPILVAVNAALVNFNVGRATLAVMLLSDGVIAFLVIFYVIGRKCEKTDNEIRRLLFKPQ